MGKFSRFMPEKSYVKVETIEEFVFLYDKYLEGKRLTGFFNLNVIKTRASLYPLYILRTTNGYSITRLIEGQRFRKYLDYTNLYKIKIAMEL